MQWIIHTEVAAATSEDGFSLDELVDRTRELFAEEGLPGIVTMILRLVDEAVSLELVQDRPGWRPPACCDAPRYEFLDRRPRRIRTSLGVVRFSWRRLRCRTCGRTCVPLRAFLGLDAYQSKTAELERLVVEVASEETYRRTANRFHGIGRVSVPRSTQHRWVAHSEADALVPPKERVEVLMADGTGYKRRPDPERGMDNKGDLRVALGIEADGNVVPLGGWSGESWEQIARSLAKGCPEDHELARVLVGDGEPGLHENLGGLTEDQQRCHWHLVHDLDAPMRRDKAPLADRRKVQKKLAGLIKVELPASDGEPVKPEDRQPIQERLQEAEAGLNDLSSDLERRGYAEAARYVQAAARRVFGYVRLWLQTGLISPRTSSFIERLMREIARRLKRIAFGWSPTGAAKMARIILKRFASPSAWAAYWRERLQLKDRVFLALRGISALPSPPIVGR